MFYTADFPLQIPALRSLRRGAGALRLSCCRGWELRRPATYLEAVTLLRSSPIVSMTRRPHTHSPTEIPRPP